MRSLQALLVALGLLAGGSARAQWVCYEAVFLSDEQTSVNFAPYTGAYIVAPIDGGSASMVFTTEADGRVYSIAANTGRYFVAANKTQRRAVISMVAQNDTARAMYQASGLLNSTLSSYVNGERKAAQVPNELSGMMLASDDESSAAGPAADGSIGMVGSAAWTAVLRVDLSRILNAKPHTMTDAIEVIAKLLQQYGYLPDGPKSEVNTSSPVLSSDAVEPKSEVQPTSK